MWLEILRLDSLFENTERLRHELQLVSQIRRHVLLKLLHFCKILAKFDIIVGDVTHRLQQLQDALVVHFHFRVFDWVREDVLLDFSELRSERVKLVVGVINLRMETK